MPAPRPSHHHPPATSTAASSPSCSARPEPPRTAGLQERRGEARPPRADRLAYPARPPRPRTLATLSAVLGFRR